MPLRPETLYSDNEPPARRNPVVKPYLYAPLGHLTFSPAHQSFVAGQ